MRCVRAGPDFADDPERYGKSGAEVLELPLGIFPATFPGKLRLLADRAGLRTLATVERLEGPGRALLEKAVLSRFDYVEVPLDTDVETRGRMLAQARRHGVKVVLSHRSARPPRSVESVLRLFQKCSRAGGDLALASFEVFRADHVRALRDASAAAGALGIPHGIAGTGSLSQLVSLLPGDLVFGAFGGRTDGLDIGLLLRLGPSTRLFAIVGEPAHPTAPLQVVNASFGAMGLDCACIQLQAGPDGPGALVLLLRELGFQGLLVGRPFRAAAGMLAPASGDAQVAISAVTVRGGALVGHDTDGPALLDALSRSGVRVHRRRAVVLGTGGAARSAALALGSRGARVVLAGRSLRHALEAAGAAAGDQRSPRRRGLGPFAPVLSVGAEAASLSSLGALLARSSLLVNTIPGAGGSLVPDSALRPGLVVVDLDCSPGPRDLTERAAESGAHTVSGTAVLGRNLSEALRLFTGVRPPRELVEGLLDESLRRGACAAKKTRRDQSF